ncbi:cytochrome P450 72A397-like isoform X1 [Prosopis cineraria]|uniref:cytochrome P450 72A397-like isoform X1 n=1 Tax=Prosopis cineraria TaxID=364024 RepID=UPI00240ECC6A|nr:cytochrome P450 72A397-like isoform X1 [Prosopis cineraria]
MEASKATIAICVPAAILVLVWAWKVVNWLWLRPKKLERLLRQQGLQGNPYTLLTGDSTQMFNMHMQAKSKPMNLSHDIIPRASSFVNEIVNKYGKSTFIWIGPIPRIIISDPVLFKEVMSKVYDYPKPHSNPLIRLLAAGLADYDGEKWTKHRRIINPAFNAEKLKIMLATFFESFNNMVDEWEKMLSLHGSCEMDVWPFLQNVTCDVISRTAFGSSYKEGKRIFELLTEQGELVMKALLKVYIPGYRFLPTGANRRMNKNHRDIRASLKDIINKREKSMEAGEAPKDDLLGILLESNHKEIQERGNKDDGMTIEDVIEECKLFHFAGQETTSVLLVWTMVLLSRYPDWQKKAREEVLQVFGNQKPDFDGLNHLKIVTMILYEVLRLYPPILLLARTALKDMKLGHLTIPAGVQLSLPIGLIHHDCELWGDDAKEFKPERFSEGVLKATKGQASFFPFGWGPRICIGQNFAMLEAKMALSLILQRFWFELSPTYAHAPTSVITLRPQYGAQIILHKL